MDKWKWSSYYISYRSQWPTSQILCLSPSLFLYPPSPFGQRSSTYFYAGTLSELFMHIHWKDWCWSWNSNTLATWCEELTHLKRPWCWERLRAGGEGDDRGWDGWMASLTQWKWVWVDLRSWCWTGRPGTLWFMGSQRVGHNWVTELNWSHMSV